MREKVAVLWDEIKKIREEEDKKIDEIFQLMYTKTYNLAFGDGYESCLKDLDKDRKKKDEKKKAKKDRQQD